MKLKFLLISLVVLPLFARPFMREEEVVVVMVGRSLSSLASFRVHSEYSGPIALSS